MKLCKESLISSISAFASRFPALCINSIVKGDDPNVSIPESYAVNTLLWRDFLSLKFSLRSCLLLSYKNHHPKLDTQHRTPNNGHPTQDTQHCVSRNVHIFWLCCKQLDRIMLKTKEMWETKKKMWIINSIFYQI